MAQLIELPKMMVVSITLNSVTVSKTYSNSTSQYDGYPYEFSCSLDVYPLSTSQPNEYQFNANDLVEGMWILQESGLMFEIVEISSVDSTFQATVVLRDTDLYNILSDYTTQGNNYPMENSNSIVLEISENGIPALSASQLQSANLPNVSYWINDAYGRFFYRNKIKAYYNFDENRSDYEAYEIGQMVYIGLSGSDFMFLPVDTSLESNIEKAFGIVSSVGIPEDGDMSVRPFGDVITVSYSLPGSPGDPLYYDETASPSYCTNIKPSENPRMIYIKISNYVCLYIDGNSTGGSTSGGTSGSSGTSGTSGIGTSGTSGISGTSGSSGSSGHQGPQGFIGTDGSSGSSGTSGNQGPQGNSGNSGTSGSSGTSGHQGPQGFQGNVGNSGTSGSSGTSGFQGPQGNVGNSGTSGSSGTSGLQGPQGNSGISGSSGTSGHQGPQGNAGNSGTSGSSGSSGSSGNSGTSGSSGTSGHQGPQGIVGNSGTSGSSGSSGMQGIQGPQGLKGNSGTSGSSGTSGDGTSGTSGMQGVQGPQGNVGTSGTSGNGTSGTSGLQGPQGFQGNVGNSGTSGSSGSSGTSGHQGPQGFQGNVGNSGTSGSSGTSGHQGPQGFQGNTGNSGTSGSSGSSGTSGHQGPQGFQGNVGNSGTSGSSGTSGHQGPQGNTGNSGTSGSSGSSGTSGHQGPQGFQGNTGNSGTSGSSGSSGTSGLQGPQGFQGNVGNSGTSGSSGSSGTSGHQGPQGFQGNVGNSGTSGSSGSSGTSGHQGPQGNAGNSGTSGSSGTSGHQGPQGNAGNSGTSGSSGTSGLQGPQGFYGTPGSNSTEWILKNISTSPPLTDGCFNVDFSSFSAVTTLNFSPYNISGVDISDWFASLENFFLSGNECYIQVYDNERFTRFGIYEISIISISSSNIKIGVNFIIGSDSYIINENYSISWISNGIAGTQGSQGPQGPNCDYKTYVGNNDNLSMEIGCGATNILTSPIAHVGMNSFIEKSYHPNYNIYNVSNTLLNINVYPLEIENEINYFCIINTGVDICSVSFTNEASSHILYAPSNVKIDPNIMKEFKIITCSTFNPLIWEENDARPGFGWENSEFESSQKITVITDSDELVKT